MVTKRQLGIAVVGFGLLVVLAITTVDFVGAGRWSGFGPLQRLGLGLGLVSLLVGFILILRGNRPA